MNIVFDLDGTLIDSAPDIQAVASALLEGLGKEHLTLDETRAFIGEGSAVFVTRMMAARNIAQTTQSHRELHRDFVARYEFEVEKAVFYPHVVEVLSGLKERGHRLGLCTNKPESPARAVMRHMGLVSVFDAVIAGGMMESRKPEPDMLIKVIEDLGSAPVLYVGDSEIDAETAQRAGAPFALFSEGYRKKPVNEIPHDWVFDNFQLLPGIVMEAKTMVTTAS